MLSKKIKELRDKISRNEPTIGSWIQLPSLNTTKLMIDAGYDWLCIDLEHGEIFENNLFSLISLIQSNNIPCFVRVRSKTAHEFSKIAELGASGVFIPNISCSKDIDFAYDNLVWPPRGKRGIGFSTSNCFGQNFNKEYDNRIDPFIIPMIENQDAITNLHSITKNSKADAFFIGPYDLSASIGKTGRFEDIEFKEILENIRDAIKKENKTLGIHIVEPSVEELEIKIKQGFNFIAYSIDTVFLNKSCQKPKI